MEVHSEKTEVGVESPERAELKRMEQEGKFVFRGSGLMTDVPQPRQAYNYPSASEEGKIPDGKPAVFASPYADVAIFMAIVSEQNVPKGLRSSFGIEGEDSPRFKVTQGTMNQIHNATGYVYVFDKNKFVARSPGEALSYESVQPVKIITVTEKDLPADIHIEDF